jgi:pyruvate/2-oxoglutarate/acetoin dehydrogenase E1 component
VPDEPETLPIGQAQVVREGRDVTLVTYGALLPVAREAAEVLAERDTIANEGIAW